MAYQTNILAEDMDIFLAEMPPTQAMFYCHTPLRRGGGGFAKIYPKAQPVYSHPIPLLYQMNLASLPICYF